MEINLWQTALTHPVKSEFTMFSLNIFSSIQVELYTYILPNCTPIQCLVHTVHSISFMSPDPVDMWLNAPAENLTEFPAVFQKVKGKCHLLQSRGSTFWPHSSRQSMTKTMRWMSAYFQSTVVFCIQFTWWQMELQLQDCKTCERAPWSAYLDHLTQWQQRTSGTQEVCVWAQRSQGASQGCGERSGVTLHRIIWINNQTQAAEKAASTEDKAWRKCCRL